MNKVAFLRNFAYILLLTTILAFTSVVAYAENGDDSSSAGNAAALTVNGVTTVYPTLADAIAAANGVESGNRVITLLRDVEETNENKKLFYTGERGVLTIDFGSHTLTCDELVSGTTSSMKLVGTTGGVIGNVSFYGPSYALGDSISNTLPESGIESGVYHGTIESSLLGNVVISGGTFTSDDNMVIADGSSVTIRGGTFTAPEGIWTDDIGGSVRIYGGTFTLTDDGETLLSASNYADISVYGGTFVAASDISGSSTGDVTLHGGTFKDGIKVRGTNLADCLGFNRAYWVSDYSVATPSSGQTEIGGSDITIDLTPEAAVKYGDTTLMFAHVEAAANHLNASDKTLQLLKDVNVDVQTGSHFIELGGSGTFDLNGHTINVRGGASAIKVTSSSGNITITDSSGKAGKITGSSGYSIWHDGRFNVSINAGTFQNVGRMHTGSLIINGGTFTSSNPLYDNSEATEGSLTLYGGTFEQGIRIQGPGQKSNVVNILGKTTLTYFAGDEIWDRGRVNALGNAREFEPGKRVSVVNQAEAIQSSAVASFADGTNTCYFTTLSAAMSKQAAKDEESGGSENHCVTLLKPTAEDITIDRKVPMTFRAKATGVFTFKGGSIYLKEPLPEGASLSAKQDAYSTAPQVVLRAAPGITLAESNLKPVDSGVKAVTVESAGVGLAHVHEYKYQRYRSTSYETISAFCLHSESCPLSTGKALASVTVRDKTVAYNGEPQRCTLEVTSSSDYKGPLPDENSVSYYDESGKKIDALPCAIGSYTARVAFGDTTIDAQLVIDRADPTAALFSFAKPSNLTYDGEPKRAQFETDDDELVGDIVVSYYDSEGNLLDDAPTDAGSYSVKISVAGGSQYKPAQGISDESWCFTIEPKQIGISWTNTSLEYNGEVQAPSATATGIIEGDEISLVVVGGKKDVGSVGEEIRVSEITGEDKGNYCLPENVSDVQFTVFPRALSVDVVVADKQYDGTNAATIASAQLRNVVEGESLGLENGIATFDSVLVADDISVSFTDFALTGEADVLKNYELIQPSGATASIKNDWDPIEYAANGEGWLNEDFVIAAAEGYQASLTDTADGIWEDTLTFSEETEDGSVTFYLRNTGTGAISLGKTVTYKLDKTAPTGKVRLKGTSGWDKLLDTITFGLVFTSEATLEADADDELSGVASIEYLESTEPLSLDDLMSANDAWQPLPPEGATLAAEDGKKFICYVKITDNAGNVTYLSTDGARYEIAASSVASTGDDAPVALFLLLSAIGAAAILLALRRAKAMNSETDI